MSTKKAKARVARTGRIGVLAAEFKRVWDSEILSNTEHRIDQTIQLFINVENADFYQSREDLISDIGRLLKAARTRVVPKKVRIRIERKLGDLVQMSKEWREEVKADQVEIDAMSYWAQQSEGFYECYRDAVRELRKVLADAKVA